VVSAVTRGHSLRSDTDKTLQERKRHHHQHQQQQQQQQRFSIPQPSMQFYTGTPAGQTPQPTSSSVKRVPVEVWTDHDPATPGARPSTRVEFDDKYISDLLELYDVSWNFSSRPAIAKLEKLPSIEDRGQTDRTIILANPNRQS